MLDYLEYLALTIPVGGKFFLLFRRIKEVERIFENRQIAVEGVDSNSNKVRERISTNHDEV